MPGNATGAKKNRFSGCLQSFRFTRSRTSPKHQHRKTQLVEVVASSGVATTLTPHQKEDANTEAAPSPQAAAAVPTSPPPPQLKTGTSAYEAAAAATLPAVQEEQRRSTAAAKEAAAVVGLLLLIFAARLHALTGRAGRALSNKFASASASVVAAAAWVSSSRVTCINQSRLQSSKEAWARCSQCFYAFTCRVTLSAWLQMLCISFWVLALYRQPTYVSTSLNSMSADASCVCASICIAVTVGALIVRLKPAAAAAWLLVTSMAVHQLQRLSKIGSSFVGSPAVQCSAEQRLFLTAVKQYSQAWRTGLVQLLSILLSGQHLFFVVNIVLVWAASMRLPTLAFDCLVAALIHSWPAALV